MKFYSANLQDLRELYINNLQKALDMEQEITKALPTMIEKSTNLELKEAFQKHLNETQGHVSTVKKILSQANGGTGSVTCKVIAALVTEAQDSIKDAGDESVRDVTLIAAGQQVEHHEIAVYGTLRNWAYLLGEKSQASLLEEILQEEKDADQTLSQVASRVNTKAESQTYSTANV